MAGHRQAYDGCMSLLLCCTTLMLNFLVFVQSTGQYPEQVLLQNVEVLTLRQGHMTSGRRSSPVPQIKCVGGTAGCSVFVPQVIQCYNRGSDGNDIQWECKSDIDNVYRFGKTEVTCEGFNYPDDPYILKGSCGVEYTLDYTKEHYDQSKSYGYDQQSKQNYQRSADSSYSGSGIIVLIIVVVIIYVAYKYFIAPNVAAAFPGQPDPYGFRPPPPYSPPGHGQGGYQGCAGAPPPPGFKTEYTGSAGSGYSTGGSASSGYFGGATGTQGQQQGGATGGMGNFMTGAATGGILGYLFGARNNTGYGGGYNQPYVRPSYRHTNDESWGGGGGGGGGSWFSGGSGARSFGAGSSGSSTGTRTASGFGGTTRR